MRTTRYVLPGCSVWLIVLLAATAPAQIRTGLPDDRPAWDVCFSPRSGCTGAIVSALDAARESVFVQAYSFTSAPIARALLNAARRGVKVEAILDKSQRSQRYSSADFLARAGIPVRVDSAHAIAHNKVIVIDGRIVITGSFNFTKAAEEQNAENVLIVRDPVLASRYYQNWQAHARHADPYAPK